MQADCLDYLTDHFPTPSFDFVYIDPPYFTRRDFTGTLRTNAPASSTLSFSDRWISAANQAQCSDRDFYLLWLRERLLAIHRVLKPGGAFVLHLDWHITHYAKVLCDDIFGYDQFRNEIIWYYQTGGASKSHFSRKHDNLLWYSVASPDPAIKPFFDGKAVAIPRTEKSLKRAKCPTGARIKLTDTHKNPDDVFIIPALNPMSNQRTGYPTQKPLELLEKLIRALCPPHGLVGDFFCGSGTTLVAAQNCGRPFIGCDLSADAVALTRQRLEQCSSTLKK